MQGLRIEGLSAGYRSRRVLDRLSLPDLPQGSLTAVIGPNAAGKTTFLKALSGLLPASGRILHGNGETEKDLLRLSQRERSRVITYMPQSLPEGIALTALETVITALMAAPRPPGRTGTAREQAQALLERIDIGHLAMSPLDSLSGGQRQLVALAQAIANEPEILLLDEPTSALDPRHQIDVMEIVRSLADERGMMALIVLHDLNLALRWADCIVLLDEHGLVAAGRPEKTVTAETLRRAYRIEARVERCSAGRLQVMIDGKAEG